MKKVGFRRISALTHYSKLDNIFVGGAHLNSRKEGYMREVIAFRREPYGVLIGIFGPVCCGFIAAFIYGLIVDFSIGLVIAFVFCSLLFIIGFVVLVIMSKFVPKVILEYDRETNEIIYNEYNSVAHRISPDKIVDIVGGISPYQVRDFGGWLDIIVKEGEIEGDELNDKREYYKTYHVPHIDHPKAIKRNIDKIKKYGKDAVLNDGETAEYESED